MNKEDLINEFTRVKKTGDEILIQVKSISWYGPHEPHLQWHTELRLGLETPISRINKEREKLLYNNKYFSVCEECGLRTPDGWMHGKRFDKCVCQSCAEKCGIIY